MKSYGPVNALSRRDAMKALACAAMGTLFPARISLAQNAEYTHGMKVVPPPAGKRYHSAFADFRETEDIVYATDITNFAHNIAGGKDLAWAYFSNNWHRLVGDEYKRYVRFPWRNVLETSKAEVVPCIRLMPRVGWPKSLDDNPFKLKNIAKGSNKRELRKWAEQAAKYGRPTMVEFGTEVNDKSFPWSGYQNGKDGSVFIDAYKRVVDIFNEVGADNVTWLFHVTAQGSPYPDNPDHWNSIAKYYPGKEYVDWIGLSVYGAQSDNDDWQSFEVVLNDAYPIVSELSCRDKKPIAILEFGVHESERENRNKAKWIREVLDLMADPKNYQRIKAISYWHGDCWTCEPDQLLRIDSSLESLAAYREGIQHPTFTGRVHFGTEVTLDCS